MSRITKTKFITMGGLLVLVCLLMTPAARADEVQIALPSISGNAGQTIIVLGALTNTTSITQYFSTDTVTFNNTVLTAIPDLGSNASLGVGPASIDPGVGGMLTGVDLFTLTIALGTAPGVYDLNYYTLVGGTDPSCATLGNCTDLLATVGFTVTVNTPVPTPEPGSLVLLVSGLLVGLLALSRATR